MNKTVIRRFPCGQSSETQQKVVFQNKKSSSAHLLPIHFPSSVWRISGENSQNRAFKVRIRQVKTGQNLCFPSSNRGNHGRSVSKQMREIPGCRQGCSADCSIDAACAKKKKNSGAKLAVTALAAVLLPALLLSDIHVLCGITYFLRCSAAFPG